MSTVEWIILSIFLSSPIFLILWIIYFRKYRAIAVRLESIKSDNIKLKDKYEPIISREEKIREFAERVVTERSRLNEIIEIYSKKRKILNDLEKQVAIYDESLSFAELGMYKPHFEFNDSEAFKAAILKIRQKQKDSISSGKATHCPSEWTVDGSTSKGKVMINRQTRLTLRAFNNECDAAIANVRWNNVVAMEQRILSAAKAINKENISMNLEITDLYVGQKIEELRLTHEYRERQKAEKEERSELARAEREEKKLLAEAEAAEREEKKYQLLLEKAKREAESTQGGSTGIMQARISELEKALADAKEASERARAMAEMTKSGYVYIISNIGSFGAEIVKIGLTRRLDPDDRIRELGDASVPFSFDTHAMIYSDNAPSLEGALHKRFADRRVNTSNHRKEFFRVTLDEIEDAVRVLAPKASFFKDREAQEWNETIAKRNENLRTQSNLISIFPDSL
jgi:hypothetical protein